MAAPMRHSSAGWGNRTHPSVQPKNARDTSNDLEVDESQDYPPVSDRHSSSDSEHSEADTDTDSPEPVLRADELEDAKQELGAAEARRDRLKAQIKKEADPQQRQAMMRAYAKADEEVEAHTSKLQSIIDSIAPPAEHKESPRARSSRSPPHVSYLEAASPRRNPPSPRQQPSLNLARPQSAARPRPFPAPVSSQQPARAASPARSSRAQPQDPFFNGTFSGHFDGKGRPIFIGPRDGTYTLTAEGKKDYICLPSSSSSSSSSSSLASASSRTLRSSRSAPAPALASASASVPVDPHRGQFTGEFYKGDKSKPIFRGSKGGSYYNQPSGGRRYLDKKEEKEEKEEKSAAVPEDPHGGVFSGRSFKGKPLFQGAHGGVYYVTPAGHRKYVKEGAQDDDDEEDEEEERPAMSSMKSERSVRSSEAPRDPFGGEFTGEFFKGDHERPIFRGPRGGLYYINKNGNKTAVKK